VARRDNARAARALAEWALEGFREAAVAKLTATYEVAPRTLWNWKKALDTDSELAGLFRDRLNDILDRDWAAHLTDALAELVQRIRALAAGEEDLGKVVEAFRALSEVAITREVLRGATDAGQDRGYATASGEDARPRPPLPN
jgi:hypothetical protein